MDNIDELIDRIRENGDDVWIAGPQSEQAIAELERALGVKLPPTFRQFLLRFGSFRILDSNVSGIIDNKPLARGAGRLYWDTQCFRREHELPDHLLVVQADEDAPYCLDTSATTRGGEFPLICYDLQSRQMERMAPNFGAWFLEWLTLQADDDA